MSEPTVEEVRARYARAIRTEHDRTWQSGADEFDAWLARVKREAAAEALEEASSAHFPLPGGPYPSGVIRDWLRARAAEIREGK